MLAIWERRECEAATYDVTGVRCEPPLPLRCCTVRIEFTADTLRGRAEQGRAVDTRPNRAGQTRLRLADEQNSEATDFDGWLAEKRLVQTTRQP